MYIVDVIPLVFLPRGQSPIVSYFHSAPLERENVVQVIFNGRKVKAVVVDCEDIKNRKAALKKQATFTLKKIDKVLKTTVIEKQIKKAQELSEYYFVPLGLCLRAVMLHPEAKNYKNYISPGPFLDLPPLTIRGGQGAIHIVDMRKEIRDANYSIFSRALKDALQTFDRIVIFIPRKGYANFLLCKDCGNGIKCQNCSVSLAVHDGLLKCHHCNYSRLMPKNCPSCQSYGLKPYGIGMDKVESELVKFLNYQNFKKPTIAKLSTETKKLPENWNVLLATQSIFKYRDVLRVGLMAIINADTLIHIPDYRAEEMLLRQTLLLASMTDRLLIQTYNPDDPALVAAADGKVEEFWKNELEQRKAYGYPPFTKLIKLTYRNRDVRIAKKIAQDLAKKLSGTAYPALIFKERGMYIWHVLLKIKVITDSLRTNLCALPPDWTIDVDPINVV